MSDVTGAKGGFGQFGDQYRERWAASHPKANPVVAPSATVGGAEGDTNAAIVPALPSPDADATIPKATRPAPSAASTAPFGRRRIPPS